MKKTLLPFMIVFLLILMSTFAFSAKEGTIKLLAVTESKEGSIATLSLKVTDGTGKIYMDTKPLTKLDTLISTRFANSIACNFLDIDCSKYDFFYTITADSVIVGGPSAGSAVSVLTVAVLDGKKIPDDIAITGTINSGGFIGSVGAVKEKVQIAADFGIRKVLVPLGDSKYDEDNSTVDVNEVAKDLGIAVVEVPDLNSAMYRILGTKYWPDYVDFKVPDEYSTVMELLSENLCARSKELNLEFLSLNISGKPSVIQKYLDEENKAFNYTSKGKDAYEKGAYYSSASYCYGANVIYRTLILELRNDTKESNLLNLKVDLDNFKEEIESLPIDTITDLQAYMIVLERISDSEYFLNLTYERFYTNDSDYYSDLAVGIERLYSAKSWSEFFGKGGKKYAFNKETLRDSCLKMISETEEHFEYVNTFVPFMSASAKRLLSSAKEDLDSGNYVMCLFRAGKAKAESDVFITGIGASEDDLDLLLDSKMNIATQNIGRQIIKGKFPILAYSYLEYAKELKDTDKYSSFLFSEYALELSNLEIYFNELKPWSLDIELSDTFIKILLFSSGLVIGFAAGILYLRRAREKRRLLRRNRK